MSSINRKVYFILISLCIIISSATAVAIDYPDERPSIESGKKIYLSNCAGCHGEKGDGSTFSGASNFTNSEKMIISNSSIFYDKITNGIPGTAMPSFSKLPKKDRWDVIAYIWTFWIDKQSAENGKKIYEKDCAGCHSMLGDGYGLPEAFDFTNLSQTASKQPSVFFDRLTQGIPGTAMRPYKSDLTENERWDAVKYLFTFQFSDYQLTVPQLTVPQTTLPQTTPAPTKPQYPGKEWYNTAGGGAIILVSVALAVFILYLFIRGLKER
ncbi:MAG: cytochrome c [Candidatus Methanoperedens sp.]|nr:cytochrome c [Candidatus Methanoperedens sp. BLZ2]KAB2941308.1 MAG: cytochrome c [Candidatus Methanoperedens sp.]MBZ0174114.1 cytochrome c [Candidatus Methanoperedens nitroreducens]MCX9079595.1 cytochrome c [Candidatus Methanoperedens sp.]